MQYNAMPCHAMTCHWHEHLQCNDMSLPCKAMTWSALQRMKCTAKTCDDMQCNAMICNAMQYNAMPCHAIQCNAMQYNAMPCNTMQCHAIQCNAMQCHVIALHVITCLCSAFHVIALQMLFRGQNLAILALFNYCLQPLQWYIFLSASMLGLCSLDLFFVETFFFADSSKSVACRPVAFESEACKSCVAFSLLVVPLVVGFLGVPMV